MKADKEHGKETRYDADGSYEETNYKDGVKDGEMIYYDKEGKAYCKEIWENGEMKSEKML